MFRAIISPILRSTRLCVTVCGIMHRRCCLPAAPSVHYTTSCNTQSSAPEDGRNYRPKLVERIGIINKPLLLHLVGCLYYCISDARSNIKSILFAFLKYFFSAALIRPPSLVLKVDYSVPHKTGSTEVLEDWEERE